MTAFEAMAVARLRQWSSTRQTLLSGRGHAPTDTPGWVERRVRNFDAAHVRVIDFERALSTLPPDSQTVLLLVYRDRLSVHAAAKIMHNNERTLHTWLRVARIDLANALDKRDLL